MHPDQTVFIHVAALEESKCVYFDAFFDVFSNFLADESNLSSATFLMTTPHPLASAKILPCLIRRAQSNFWSLCNERFSQ